MYYESRIHEILPPVNSYPELVEQIAKSYPYNGQQIGWIGPDETTRTGWNHYIDHSLVPAPIFKPKTA